MSKLVLHNLESAIVNSELISAKVKSSNIYAQNLYAALCNNEFYEHSDIIEILKDSTWSCSWRSAGGIIADIRGRGDYLDWYCSGIKRTSTWDTAEYESLSLEHQAEYLESTMYVEEQVVTEEIAKDLKAIGWAVVNN